ncbi:MAG TPA: DMT family transporter [Amaricoccus sp.]|uniref:DMT family transporter n=1 Tax=Amaricoccus sp. TaxID=1872485 RepID=UPI002CBB07D7|nr:DMT family transporter [Amaricoccus sp.]HMQ95208.1 DMT family transporter [Amaricoccus sp.]HMR53373.1 DMT family transporter [Amaricoccus sp.]HMR59790.1 DMT family transporter [Amaricoccus sp.]HMU00311.1 DMT family transporter [Amaricoccus sp.]
MSTPVFLAVLAAALLHAAWNALVKQGADKHLGMTAVVIGHVPIALVVLPFVPFPAPESWPWLLAGLLLHTGYQLFLMMSYRIGDLTQVYPIARGTAPLLVAGVSVAFLGVHLAPLELLGVLTIGAGIMSMSLVRQRDGLRNRHAALLALATGGFIAAYSLVDGTGARLAGTALGYFGWASIGNAAVFSGLMALTRPGLLTQVFRRGKRAMLLGGGASFVAYSMVIWAFTQAPIALVTALRETSIVFALLIGVFLLGERLDLAKVASTMVTLLGGALLRLAR